MRALLFIAFFTLTLFSLAAQNTQWSSILQEKHSHHNVSSQLLQLAKYAAINPSDALQKAKNGGLQSRPDGKVYIEIQYGWNPDEMGDFSDLISSHFEFAAAAKNLVGGWIYLKDVLSFSESITDAKYLLTCANNSETDHEGTIVTGMSQWTIPTFSGILEYGVGVNVAIIDGGYEMLTAAQNAGTAPVSLQVTQVDLTGTGLPFESGGSHGTGVLEACYPFATGSEYYLYKITSNAVQLATAVSHAIADDVDIIIHSASYFNTGWADNSGIICSIVEDATDNDIFWINSAGNNNETHAQASFDDTDGDLLHNWSAGTTKNTTTVTPGGSIQVLLQWIGILGAANNFDLILKDSNFNIIGLSNSFFDYETISWTNNTGSTQTVHIEVQRTNGSNKKFEIFALGNISPLSFSATGSSTASPANSTEALCLEASAVYWGNYDNANPPLENFSSYGPTNGGAIAVDFCLPDGFPVTAYPSGMFGTSASAPCLGGLIAALKDEYSDLSNTGILELAKALAAESKDWGLAGQDDLYGHGGIYMPACLDEPTEPSYCFLPDYYIIDGIDNSANSLSLPFESIQQANSLAPANKRIYFIGGNHDHPPLGEGLIDKQMLYKAHGSNGKVTQ